MTAVRFADALGPQDGLLSRRSRPSPRPVPHDYFLRHRTFLAARAVRRAAHGRAARLRRLSGPARRARRRAPLSRRHGDRGGPQGPAAALSSSPGTTRRCAASSVDPTITYLQALYPVPDHVERVEQMTAHLRRRGAAAPRVHPLRRRDRLLRPADRPLHQRGAARRDHRLPRGQWLPDLQPAPLHARGRRHEARPTQAQLAFKREADPKGLLNPGKMIAWENPGYGQEEGRAFLYESR